MPMRVWVYSRGLLFIPPMLDSLEHLWMPGYGFPGLQGRKNLSIFLLLDYWATFIPGIRGSTIIPKPGGWLRLFFFCNFFFSTQSGFIWINAFVERERRSGLFFFLCLTTLWVNNQIETNTLALPPHWHLLFYVGFWFIWIGGVHENLDVRVYVQFAS